MIIDIVMPKMGESINEGTILEWRKKVGEKVKLDEILLEIGTDKVDSEIPSSAEGVLIEILAEPNAVKEVGEVIARIDTEGNSNATSFNPNKEKEVIDHSKSTSTDTDSNAKNIKPEKYSSNKKSFYTPLVLKIAAEHNLPFNELENIQGTGRGARVTKKDILLYLESRKISQETSPIVSDTKSIFGNNKTEEMHHMRKMIAKHMLESISTSAHVYVMTEVDMTLIVNSVKEHDKNFKDREGFSLTFTPYIVDSVVKSIKEFPEINSSVLDDKVVYHKDINIGLAVAVDNGLMVPTMKNCEEKNFLGLCRSVNDVATRARSNSISSDELSGSTFSITNFGVFGVSIGTPIINQPNVGILGVGAIKKQPVVIEEPNGDSIAIRNMMMLTLGFDHRLIDGAGGSKFLELVRYYLEHFDLVDI